MITLMWMVGVIAIGLGLLWAAQGSGLFPYPSSSFMIGDVGWAYYGLVTAIGGIAVILMARRRGRRGQQSRHHVHARQADGSGHPSHDSS